jgi:electron transfer flavoprotein alpha subunit
MSVLVFAENSGGTFKKAAFEAITYGYKTAQVLGTDCVAICLGEAENAAELGQYGASKVLSVSNAALNNFDSLAYNSVISQAAKSVGASVVVLMHNSTGKGLVGGLSARLDAGSAPGVNQLPTNDGAFRVKKNVYSGKAIAEVELKSAVKVISVMGNSFQPEVVAESCAVEEFAADVPTSRITVKEINKVKGTVPLPEADFVVSAGRGMKGPENWGIIEELAELLGAATACSRPVADTDWRPHHEHVGQTGVAIRPNLYFAIGISGAIQHLAGVNSSKVIVVINKDPEAPFFKAADYGVCADLFDVVPKLIESFKKMKANA